ncbi:MAG: acyltransferase [Coriobacteriia bacterium]|nr:acyltransferase [Coriobacteriia bacterium]
MSGHPHGSHRLFSVDALKGFAISCVVLGHVLLRSVPEPADNALYLLLSAFEMPLFMFLSGFVLPGRVRGPRPQWVWRRAVRLMVPFLAWHAIFFLSLRVTTLNEQQPVALAQGLVGYLARIVVSPTAGLWYLPALVLCSAVLALFYNLAERPLTLLAAGWVTLLLLAWAREALGVAPDFGLLKTVTYWPFFAAGFTWGQWKRPLQPDRPLLKWVPLLAYPLIAVPLMRTMGVAGALAGGALKVVLGLAGTAAAAVLIEFAEPVARRFRLDALGRLTLGVYCAQWLFLRVEFGSSLAAIAASFAFTLAGSIAVTLVIGRVPVLKGVLLGEWPRKAASASSR